MSSSVAAIVPVFNRAGLVMEALESIAAQTQPPRRLIIVDDGSTDGSGDAVDRWLSRARPRCEARLIRQANLGAPAAPRNRAIREAADCGLIAFLDSDDLWPPDYLERMTAAAAQDEAAIAFTADHRLLSAATGQSELVSSREFSGALTALFFRRMTPLPSCTVVRGEAFHLAGGFNEQYRVMEDIDLFLRMSLLGHWRSVPGSPVTRRMEARSACGGPDQLSAQYAASHDVARAALELLHRFLFDLRAADRLPREVWSVPMVDGWAALACRHIEGGRLDEAVACLDRAQALSDGRSRTIADTWRRMARRAQADGDRKAASFHYLKSWRADRRRVGRLLRSLWLRLSPGFSAP